jgi:hypothetical protein
MPLIRFQAYSSIRVECIDIMRVAKGEASVDARAVQIAWDIV